MRMRFLLVPAAMIIGPGAAAAQDMEGPPNSCDYARTAQEREIACTREIDSGRLGREDLVRALRLRAVDRLMSHNNLLGALSDLNRAVTLRPNDAGLLGLRASTFMALKDYPRAIADLNALIRDHDDPRMGGSHRHSRGRAYFATNQLQAASRDFAEVLLLVRDPKHPVRQSALTYQCLALARLGQGRESVQACDTAIAEQPQSVTPREARGQANLILRRFDAALADFDAVLAQSPDRATSLYGRGLARVAKGQNASGRDDLATAVALYPRVVDGYRALGLGPRG